MSYTLNVEQDVAIPTRDGGTVCANVFRPNEAGAFPAIVTMGPYPKDIPFEAWNPVAWQRLPGKGRYMHWETVDPEWWVPNGYAVVRCDSRGTGKSQGRARLLSPSEAEDFHDAIEWAGAQPWSNGKVGVMGISYFAMTAWRVAALRPPHLAAIVPWEGAVDLYRDANRHGGIFSNGFLRAWASHRRERSRDAEAADAAREAGDAQGGAAPLPPETYVELYARNHPAIADIEVPLLSAGNWGGAGLHLRGNVEGWLEAGSAQKWLQIHVGDHVAPFYSLEGRLVQLRFLEQFLRGVDTGMSREPRVRLAIRDDGDRYHWSYEDEWPIARTVWTELWLDCAARTIAMERPTPETASSYSAERGAADGSVAFSTAQFERETQVTGPVALKLWLSSSGDDADLFAVLRNVAPDGSEVTYPGPMPGGPRIAAAYGWLRASHRKVDPARSTPYRPFHTHDEIQKLTPGQPVCVDVEIWPTSIVLAPGHRLVLEIGSHDDPRTTFQHDDPCDRVHCATNTIHTGGRFDSRLLLPIVPKR
ncbi:MAG TPA: CocE/NonD family hydrolase [Candidatus Binatia bacterium]|nr:CocE/NonD family hydrolase [Candidatus Binatia bacterium]